MGKHGVFANDCALIYFEQSMSTLSPLSYSNMTVAPRCHDVMALRGLGG